MKELWKKFQQALFLDEGIEEGRDEAIVIWFTIEYTEIQKWNNIFTVEAKQKKEKR